MFWISNNGASGQVTILIERSPRIPKGQIGCCAKRVRQLKVLRDLGVGPHAKRSYAMLTLPAIRQSANGAYISEISAWPMPSPGDC